MLCDKLRLCTGRLSSVVTRWLAAVVTPMYQTGICRQRPGRCDYNDFSFSFLETITFNATSHFSLPVYAYLFCIICIT
jgi:hypothetical protein